MEFDMTKIKRVNPIAKALLSIRKQVVPSKKGKGSYNREKYKKYYDKIENNLPKDYSFGYIGNIWDKWQSDDRGFYIEDNTGKKLSRSYYDINEIDKLWYALERKLKEIV